MLFGIFKKEMVVPENNFSGIHTDMHSHILPAIDDGAPNVTASIEMAKRFCRLGFRKLIATPHIMADYYKNTPERINKSLGFLREALETNKIQLEVHAAAEYYLDELFEKKIINKELLTFGDNNVLFELSYINMPNNLDETIYRLKDAGYNPVLAHPERYPYFHNGIENYLRIKDLGCELQVNTISLTGYYGKTVKKAAEELLESQVMSYIGSDMHHLRHADALEDALKIENLQNLLTSGILRNNTL